MTAKGKDTATETTEGKDPVNGHFLPGNTFWRARSSHGRKPIFADADQLRDACEQYFDWVDANPLFEDRLVTFQGKVTHEPVAKMRAMTLAGLTRFIGIDRRTWNEWRESRSDFSEVIAEVEAVIADQKFTGAAADLLNANLISRDLGLADKTELTGNAARVTGPLNVNITTAPSGTFLRPEGDDDAMPPAPVSLYKPK